MQCAAQRAARLKQFQQSFLDFGENFMLETIVTRRERVEHVGMLGEPWGQHQVQDGSQRIKGRRG